MSVKLDTTLQHYLGWCPQAQVQKQRSIVQPCEQGNVSGKDSKTPVMDFAWYRQYRIFLIAVLTPVVIYAAWMFATSGGCQFSFALLGIVPAAILGGIDLARTHRFFREVRTSGSANEISRSIRSSIAGAEAVAWMVFLVFLFQVNQTGFTGTNPASVSALISGFLIVFSVLYLLFIFAWEKGCGIRMYMRWPHYYTRKD